MRFPKPTVVLAFLLGVASIAFFQTILTYQASNCSYEQQTQRAETKPDDGTHEKKQKPVSEPFACGVAGVPTAVRQFMNHNEGFVVGGFTFLLVFVTGWLVYVTGGLRESTEKLWLAGEKQIEVARIAANAADLSARAAIGIELPIIRVAPNSLSFGQSRDGDNPWTEYCVVDSLIFSNRGRTKAFPIEVRCGWTVGDRLPDVPTYKTITPFNIELIFEPDPKITPKLRTHESVIELATGDQERIRKNDTSLWFYCCVVYADFMQNRHEAGFCWLWHDDLGKGVFRADPIPAYNRKT